NNFYYQIETNVPSSITSDKAVFVAQYIVTPGCKTNASGNNGSGDPEMVLLSPVLQGIKNATFYMPSFKNGIAGATYASVLAKTSVINSLKFDGTTTVDTGSSSYGGAPYGSSAPVAMANAFKTHPADATYSLATFKISYPAIHTITADSNF